MGARAAAAGEAAPDAAVDAAVAVGRTPAFKEPHLAEGRLFWLEQRPQERGRTTLLMRAAGSDGPGRELTPGPWDLRSRVHGYGGGVYAVAGAVVVFIHDGDRCLWSLELPPDPASLVSPAPPPAPRRLTAPQGGRAFADGLIDQRRQRWIGVMEENGRDLLVTVPLAGGEPQVLHQPADFCGYAVLSPNGSHLAWVRWQQPSMPWDHSELWLGGFDSAGGLAWCRAIAGNPPEGWSVFQPLWLGTANGAPADLVVANDRSGWWNLERLAAAESLAAVSPLPRWQPLLTMEAEFAMPQWVYGMRTTAWDGERLLAAACVQGCWHLGRITPAATGESPWEPIEQPFDDLAGLDAEAGRLVAIASAPRHGPGLLELDSASGRWRHTPAAPCPLAAEQISTPAPLWFTGANGQATHSWFYPPSGGASPASPLLIRAHSGPTGMARTGLNLAVQFWTSRGWGVVDVNYGGSTGFGRAYRQRLDGQWGVVDVADCAAAARAVVAAGQADPAQIAMEGGSAAGFTVLALLCFERLLGAGACRYPVTDLSSLAKGDHRFEARYCDSLVGPWPAARALYEARSPLQHGDRIERPVILFHGLDDQVVPAEQSERMALALSQRGVPVELHLIPGEGHGFRDQATQVRVLEATEAFFRRQFGR